MRKAVRATCTLQKVPWHSEQLLTGNTMKLKSEGICQSLLQGFGWDINKEQDFSDDSDIRYRIIGVCTLYPMKYY